MPGDVIVHRLTVAVLLLALVAGCGRNETPASASPGSPASTSAPSGAAAPSEAVAAAGPRLGAWHALVELEGMDRILLVNGGPEVGHAADAPLELWSWDGAAWSQVPVEGEWPTWRNFGSVAWDAGRRTLVVHGGLQSRDRRFAETWEWVNGSWRLAHAGGPESPSPGFREGAAAAWDPESGRTILFAGASEDAVRGDTWAWDGSAWEQLAADGSGPSPRFPAMLEPDAIGGGLLLYGGHVIDDDSFSVGDTWRWTSAAGWKELVHDSPPGPRVNAGSAWFEPLGRLVLVGGGRGEATVGDVWGWDGAAWSLLAADAFPPRQAHGLAYDGRTGRLLLSGGLDEPGTSARYSDLWAWGGDGRAIGAWWAGR